MNGPCYRLAVLEKLKKDAFLNTNLRFRMLANLKTKKSGQ